jgi:VanZ family protein
MDRSPASLRRVLTIAPAALWAGVIFVGSSLPGSSVPGRFAVAGHLAEYAVFGFLVFLAVTRTGAERRAAWIALLLCSAYAVTDEVHQLFVPGRSADPLDWTADTIGSAAGVCAALIALRWRSTMRARRLSVRG